MTKLNIQNEFDQLKTVLVCYGENIPIYEVYKTDDPQFTKFHPYSWDHKLFIEQQKQFFELLTKYNVDLIFPKTAPHLIWQSYTRDTAFVVGRKLYYCSKRKMEARNGELEFVLEALDLPNDQLVAVDEEIEGGDVLVSGNNSVYIGHSSRTSEEASKIVAKHLNVKMFELGEFVMHLDTRLTLISETMALCDPLAFNEAELSYIKGKYKIIEVFESETKKLGTNVFLINPETVVVPTQHKRIGNEIEKYGFKVEYIDYSEPINLGGSFRCTTMPIEREG